MVYADVPSSQCGRTRCPSVVVPFSMWLAGAPLYSVIASVSFVNTRQMLYSAAFSPYFSDVGKPLAFFFSATVTDESFGVSLDKFVTDGTWTPRRALLVNLMGLVRFALILYAATIVFQLVTLPVEINASRRAVAYLSAQGSSIDQEGAKQVLTAAALTYVAAALASLLQFLYLLARTQRD